MMKVGRRVEVFKYVKREEGERYTYQDTSPWHPPSHCKSVDQEAWSRPTRRLRRRRRLSDIHQSAPIFPLSLFPLSTRNPLILLPSLPHPTNSKTPTPIENPTMKKIKITYLHNLIPIPLIRAGPIIRQGFRACEFMVRGRGGDDVAVAGDLAGEAGDRAGYCCLLEWMSVLLVIIVL